jgi:hypothetical protein
MYFLHDYIVYYHLSSNQENQHPYDSPWSGSDGLKNDDQGWYGEELEMEMVVKPEFVQGGSKDGQKAGKKKKEVTFNLEPEMSWREDKEKNDVWNKRKIDEVEEVVEGEKKRQKGDQVEAGDEESPRKRSNKKVQIQEAIGEVLTRSMVKKRDGEPRRLRPRSK